MTKVFAFGGTSIADMTDKELLKAIRKNEESRNYPDSATTILIAEGVKRIIAGDIDLAEKQAAARERVVREMTGLKGDDEDNGTISVDTAKASPEDVESIANPDEGGD